MNFRRLQLKAAASTAFAVAGVLLAIALGLFLYALLKQWVEPPIAAGLAFLAFSILAAIVGLWLGAQLHSPPIEAQHAAGAHASLPERAMELARRRPIVVLAAGAVLAVFALRNPTLLATLAGAALSRSASHRR